MHRSSGRHGRIATAQLDTASHRSTAGQVLSLQYFYQMGKRS